MLIVLGCDLFAVLDLIVSFLMNFLCVYCVHMREV